MLASLVFSDDPRQVLRIERLLAGTSMYPVAILVVYGCTRFGLMRDGYATLALAAAICLNLLLYIGIRLRLNLRLSDPSLAAPQIIIAILVNSYLVLHGGAARGAFLIGYLVILAFATLSMRPRQVMLIGCAAAAFFGGIIGFELATQRSDGNLRAEILQWLALLVASPGFALVASHIRRSRRELKESHQRLVAATRDHEAALRTIQEQATRDELTGVFNRRYMAAALRQEASRTDRTHEPFCILMLDIDNFKSINDRVGHIGGDHALVAVTAIVAPQLRAIDHFSRHGGEEFLVLMPSTSIDAALYAAERIRKCVEEAPIDAAGTEVRVTVSIGVAEYRAGGSTDLTLAEADRALYRAKHNGRNRVESARAAPSALGVRSA